MSEVLFVGREQEIDLYKQFLSRETPWALIIIGLGGIGKTTLLHRLAEYTLSKTWVVALDFADEELRNDPLNLLDKLTKDTVAQCDLQQLDVEFTNTLQQNLDQLAQLSAERVQSGVSESEDPALREIRHQMRALKTEAFYTQIKTFKLDRLVIMLDTCEWLNEPEGVEFGQWVLNELIPGIHTRIRQKGQLCSVVMASRALPRLDVIKGREQRRLTLSMLGKAEVDQYLEHMGMQDPALRQRVYEVTHGHALCVSIIGDFWQHRGEQTQPFTIADLPELQLQEFSEKALMQFTNERVLKQLRSPFKELTSYGVLLRSFDLPLLKGVFLELLPEPEALERFNQLIRYPYIESRGNYRYAFHELVREALAEETQKEKPEKWKSYHKRALDYFTKVSPRPPDWYYHLLAYDERQGLLEWQQAIQEARSSGKREYIGALLQAALDKALKLSLATYAEIVYEQGRFNHYFGQLEEALKSYEGALDAFQKVEDYAGQAMVLQAIGDVQRALAKHEDALENYEQALVSFHQVGDQFGEAITLQAIGDVQRLRNNQDTALQSYEQALTLFRQGGDQSEEAKVLEAVGDVQRLRNDQNAALRSYEQALALYQEEKDRLKRAKVLKAIGDVQQLQHDKNAAVESYRQALALFGELKEPAEEASVRRAMDEMQHPQSEQEMLSKSNGQASQLDQSTTVASPPPVVPEGSPELTKKGRKISRRQVITGAGAALLALAGVTVSLVLVGRNKPPTPTPTPTPSSIALQPQHLLTYQRHTNEVDGVAWSPDGKIIASGSRDWQVHVWDSVSGDRLYTYTGHKNWVFSVAWSLNGQRVASSSADSTVQVWDSTTGKDVVTYLGHPKAVVAIAWSPNGKNIASASVDKTVQVWDEATSHTLFTYNSHTAEVDAVAWSPDGKRIASGGGTPPTPTNPKPKTDTTVQVWDAMTGLNVLIYKGHSAQVDALAWSPDGKRIASGSVDQTVQVWNAATGERIRFYSGHSDKVLAAAWSPDGKYIASGSADATVQVWQP